MTPALSRAVLPAAATCRRAVVSAVLQKQLSTTAWRVAATAKVWRGTEHSAGIKGTRGLCTGGEVSHKADDEGQEIAAVVNFELPPTDIEAALTPRELVEKLGKYIVGQEDAKRAVAIALRNRWRRSQLRDDLRGEVNPKNILMIGPTGCGKTEIARRIAKLSQAPFIKVEATKFTEVGFHGKDVDSIVKDLVEASIAMTKKQQMEQLRPLAAQKTEEAIVELLVGKDCQGGTRTSLLALLRDKQMEHTMVKVDLPANRKDPMIATGVSIMDKDKLMELLSDQMSKSKRKLQGTQEMKVKDARPLMEEMEIEKRLDMSAITALALKAVEQSGIVFIDEIDKICHSGDRYKGADASAEGVQRDLLPMIEGSSVSTKHGNVNTEFILFIASGAFHSCKPSDLLAELQGRLPIRVQLKGLTEDDMYLILTEPVNNLIRQQVELMKTEKVDIQFTDEAIREVARVAASANKTIENIGARRLHTVLERIVESISFSASEMEEGSVVVIDKALVMERVGDMLERTDLSKYII